MGDETSHTASESEYAEEDETSAITLGRYQHALHHRDGIFSTVYKARKAHVNAEGLCTAKNCVALKLTTPAMMEKPHDSEREARILQTLEHSNIIPLLETFRVAGGHFLLVFQYMPYELDRLLEKQRLRPSQAKSCLHDLFSALEYLHDHGIIHRDVKPSNILLRSSSGPAYLCDFGIAWSPTDTASERADDKITDVGTTAYRPPELLFGHKSYGTKLDMWAAGCVVAEVACLSTTPLFEPGDLGTELALIRSIFSSLGTPDLDVWPVRREHCSNITYALVLTKRPLGGRRIPRLGQDALEEIRAKILVGPYTKGADGSAGSRQPARNV